MSFEASLGVVLARPPKHAEAVYKQALQLDPSLQPVKMNRAIACFPS
ncbi:MAG: hypothetical protein L0312_11845 [Acidobacteria bacterium]|nr:hypothetical protein [Acidobacteriota bacterium]